MLRLGSLPTATPCPSPMSPVDGSHHPILPSSRPATCDDDGRQCVCPTSQPPLPSAVCRLPSAPACPVTANQGWPFVMHAHSVPLPPTTPTTTSRTSCKQTRPMCGKDSDQTLERHVGTPNATLASMTFPRKVQTGYTHTPQTPVTTHPAFNIQALLFEALVLSRLHWLPHATSSRLVDCKNHSRALSQSNSSPGTPSRGCHVLVE